MNNLTSRAISVSIAAFLFGLASTGIVAAQSATISSTLDFGARGADVTALQQFLATDASIYPEGLVTGYFGALTQAAVQRFQCAHNIVCSGSAASTGYGRVGPTTLATINGAIGGNVSTTGDVSAPIITNVVVSTTTTSATVTWVTNEPARGTLYYSASSLSATESSDGTGAVMSGQTVSESGFGFNHALSASGLQSGTWYHYALGSVDASGNVQYTWPTIFHTAP